MTAELGRGLAVHLRVFAIHGATLRVVTLRPQTTARFSTNYFHDTWHILAGGDGAAIFGRLLWGLAFQRHPGTVVLIDRTHLVPTPFEADPPTPILLVPAGLTAVEVDTLRALRQRLRRAPSPPTTIRWHTFGMPAALAAAAAPRHQPWRRDPAGDVWRDAEHRALRTRERMSKRAGFICYTAPAAILRSHALAIYRMRTCVGSSSYHPLAEHSSGHRWGIDGELQLIPHFDDAVSAAVVARREVLGDRPAALVSDDDRQRLYRRTDRALERLHASRRRDARGGHDVKRR
ncbi:MAG: hypothetical protein M3680_14855 [Myxococcota bacterium]|nr:hypothetical protein [Myxococcota bacterium]